LSFPWYVVEQLADAMHSMARQSLSRSPAELRDIRRLSVLKPAAAFAASRPDMKSADVVAVAERWLAWVEAKPSTPFGVD
jgi:hypothetical protein